MTRGIAFVTASAVAAALAPLPVQLAFAIAGIGVVGMVHGAGDLALVDRSRRRVFLAAYAAASLATLLWWTSDPAVALPAFLLASAIHFGLEDAPDGTVAERAARGIALVAGPATLHVGDYADLLRIAGGPSSSMPAFAPLLGGAGAVTCGALLLLAWQRGDRRLAGGIVALTCLPPLIGFTLGFLILHALPQTIERRDRLGCSSTGTYLASVAPVFAAAILVAGMVGTLLSYVDPSGVRGLFAGIAALAIPHLLVTPWFEASASSSAREPALGRG